MTRKNTQERLFFFFYVNVCLFYMYVCTGIKNKKFKRVFPSTCVTRTNRESYTFHHGTFCTLIRLVRHSTQWLVSVSFLLKQRIMYCSRTRVFTKYLFIRLTCQDKWSLGHDYQTNKQTQEIFSKIHLVVPRT